MYEYTRPKCSLGYPEFFHQKNSTSEQPVTLRHTDRGGSYKITKVHGH